MNVIKQRKTNKRTESKHPYSVDIRTLLSGYDYGWETKKDLGQSEKK